MGTSRRLQTDKYVWPTWEQHKERFEESTGLDIGEPKMDADGGRPAAPPPWGDLDPRIIGVLATQPCLQYLFRLRGDPSKFEKRKRSARKLGSLAARIETLLAGELSWLDHPSASPEVELFSFLEEHILDEEAGKERGPDVALLGLLLKQSAVESRRVLAHRELAGLNLVSVYEARRHLSRRLAEIKRPLDDELLGPADVARLLLILGVKPWSRTFEQFVDSIRKFGKSGS